MDDFSYKIPCRIGIRPFRIYKSSWYWDKNRISELISEYDSPKKMYPPKVSRIWVNAGIIYISSLLIICFVGSKNDMLSKTVYVIALFILVATTLYSNFVFWKKSN